MRTLPLSLTKLSSDPRLINPLEKVGITTVQQLVKTSEIDLMKTRNFGRKAFDKAMKIKKLYQGVC